MNYKQNSTQRIKQKIEKNTKQKRIKEIKEMGLTWTLPAKAAQQQPAQQPNTTAQAITKPQPTILLR
jgi:hypothetical protein